MELRRMTVPVGGRRFKPLRQQLRGFEDEARLLLEEFEKILISGEYAHLRFRPGGL
jgi:hypothetical protein